MWATRALIAQLVLLVFTFILVGITGDYVQNNGYLYSSYSSSLTGYSSTSSTVYTTKYQITQAQLAFGIMLMFSGFFYVGLYVYWTIVALWRPHHTLDTPHLFREWLYRKTPWSISLLWSFALVFYPCRSANIVFDDFSSDRAVWVLVWFQPIRETGRLRQKVDDSLTAEILTPIILIHFSQWGRPDQKSKQDASKSAAKTYCSLLEKLLFSCLHTAPPTKHPKFHNPNQIGLHANPNCSFQLAITSPRETLIG